MSQIAKRTTTGGPIPPTIATTYNGNTGSATPAANILNVPGNNLARNGLGTWTSGVGDTLSIFSAGTAIWVVSPVGTHTTIQAATTAASAGDIIFITGGTYAENVTIKNGVHYFAYGPASVSVLGKWTDGGAGVSSQFKNITFVTNADYFIELSGTGSTINLLNCTLSCTNNTGINLNGTTVSVYTSNCMADVGTTGIGLYTGSGAFTANNMKGTNSGNSTTPSNSSGTTFIFSSDLNFPLSSSGSGGVQVATSILDTSSAPSTCIAFNGSGPSGFFNSTASSGNQSALSIGASGLPTVSNCTIGSSNTNAIAGTGQLSYGALRFTSSSGIQSTLTLAPLQSTNDAYPVTTPGAYPFTFNENSGTVLIDTSAVRAITCVSGVEAGVKITLKDATGSAATNNATFTPAGGGTVDGSATLVLNTNRGAFEIQSIGSNNWTVI